MREGVNMEETDASTAAPKLAFVCGVLGVIAAVWVYWLIVPGVILGAVAVAQGWRDRRRGHRERGSVAIALGVVAVLLVPSVLLTVDAAEDWARDCALDPDHDPNC